jgi:hypothetical protein
VADAIASPRIRPATQCLRHYHAGGSGAICQNVHHKGHEGPRRKAGELKNFVALCVLRGCRKTWFPAAVATSAAKAAIRTRPLIAALKRCATQKQNQGQEVPGRFRGIPPLRLRDGSLESHPFGSAQGRLLRKRRARMGHPRSQMSAKAEFFSKLCSLPVRQVAKSFPLIHLSLTLPS